jgi:hypothetical protein
VKGRWCCSRAIRRNTAQKQQIEIVIKYPHHPSAGERIPVLRRITYADGVHFIIEQPDGSRLVIPGWMTEFWAATLPMVDIPRLSLATLEELRRIVEISHLPSSPSSKTNQRGDDDGTESGMSAARSVDGNRRSPSAARDERSQRNHQSAQAASQRMRPRSDGKRQGGR